MKPENQKMITDRAACLPFHVINGVSNRTRELLAFMEIMTERHGGLVADKGKDGGVRDWGQAVARALFGSDWSPHAALFEDPPPEVDGVMDAWLDGAFPGWLALPWSDDRIQCGGCGEKFDPGDLGAVMEHEHRGLPEVKGIIGKPVAS